MGNRSIDPLFWITQHESKGTVKAGGRFICLTCYHHDRLGSTAYLTDNVAGAVASFTGYDDYGAPTMKTIRKQGNGSFA